MKTMRINLHIRKDLNPRLYAALEKLSGKRRAEFIRRLAELYLMLEENGNNKSLLPPHSSPNPLTHENDAAPPPDFGEDLQALLNDDQTISFDHDDEDDIEEK